ncbi:MAG: ATP-dependent DNA helicase [Lachnospiraceae bacterium]|nr:ATP-dependent DNA helicase [Lachnospiraceae bacterium]
MEIYISVRGLVEFLLRSGDIDNRRGTDSEKAMAEGARLHRKLQSGMGAFYRAEYSLKERVELPNYSIVIDGRADGVILDKESEHVIIDEIKCTYTELDRIAEPYEVHLAQAKVYAYIYAKQNGLDEIGVRMTYCNIETENVKYFTAKYSFRELSEWFDALIFMYQKWADYSYEWGKRRTETIGGLSFPFAYREGQKQLLGYVYQTILEKKKLFIQASTGVGKTISTIYPMLKAMGEGRLERIFYLTAKTVTGTVARETYDLLREQGLAFKSLTITAKEKICPMTECICNPDHCPYAKGHYDRINDAVYDLLTTRDSYDRDTISEYALEYEVCPFEMSLDMSLFSDGIICDYNYLFDPYAYLHRYFAGDASGSYGFLIDEAHNLVDRGREMYSAVLYKKTLVEFEELVEKHSRKLVRLAEQCNQEMYTYMTEDDYYIRPGVGKLITLLDALCDGISFYMSNNEKSPIIEEILNYYFIFMRFLDTAERLDDEYYVVYCAYDDEEEFFVKEYCVDPSRELGMCMSKGECSVLFSATFLPIQYYKSLLGGGSGDYEAYAQSHFPPERQLQLIAEDVTSKYKRRDEKEYRKIARYIHEVILAKEGNYMVFFPSHAFMEQVKRYYSEMYYMENNVRILMQESRMDESAREKFLDEFQLKTIESFDDVIKMEVTYEEDGEDSDGEATTLVGFCVMGGIFGEGIDLKEDSLIGVIVVGTGLPQVGAERNILKDHFDAMGKNGFDYAYRYPGMNKVLQAAGRVIRTDKDAGVIVLMDERFLQSGYQGLFPIEWKQQKVISLDGIKRQMLLFWNRISGEESSEGDRGR